MSLPMVCRDCKLEGTKLEMCHVRKYQFELLLKKCPQEIRAVISGGIAGILAEETRQEVGSLVEKAFNKLLPIPKPTPQPPKVIDQFLELPVDLVFWKTPIRAIEAKDVDDMARSFMTHGQIHPIVVEGPNEVGKYEGACGRLRYEATKRFQGRLVLARVHKFKHTREKRAWQLAENLHRKEIKPLEKAEAYKELYDSLSQELGGVHGVVTAIAETIEKATGEKAPAERTVEQYIQVARELPEKVKEKIVVDHDFGLMHGVQLLRLKDQPDKQLELAEELAKRSIDKKPMTVQQLKKEVNKTLKEKVVKGPYVSKSGVEWTDYALNIYFGCGHNCEYCYAKLMNERTQWVEKWDQPKKREINLEELSKELDKLKPGMLFFCSITDAYQPLNRELNWASEVLKVLLSKKHITTLILTKSADVKEDLDAILRAHNSFHNVKLGFTITSLDDEANRKYEPYSSPPTERIRVLTTAHKMGIPTFVSIEPWILGHTNPVEIVSKLKDYVNEWIFGIHNYSDTKIEDYQPLLGELHTFLIKNEIKFRMKAELDRAFKSSPVLSREHFLEAEQKMVGQR